MLQREVRGLKRRVGDLERCKDERREQERMKRKNEEWRKEKEKEIRAEIEKEMEKIDSFKVGGRNVAHLDGESNKIII